MAESVARAAGAVASAANATDARATLAEGEPLAGEMQGLVSAFQFSADGTPHELAVDASVIQPPDGWLWLHFNLADARACRFLKSVAYVPAAATEILTVADEHQQLLAKDGCLYGIFADLVCGLEGITEEIGFLHFAMTDRLLVSGASSQSERGRCHA